MDFLYIPMAFLWFPHEKPRSIAWNAVPSACWQRASRPSDEVHDQAPDAGKIKISSWYGEINNDYIWLVVVTILKNISQWEGLSHILWKN